MTADSSKDRSTWERLEQGRQVKASNGGYAGYGSPAFGQRSLNGELVNDPLESQIIELIRRHHKSGKSLQRIADWLNDQGYRTKRGQLWQRISVKRVLDRLYGKTPRISETGFAIDPKTQLNQGDESLVAVPSDFNDAGNVNHKVNHKC